MKNVKTVFAVAVLSIASVFLVACAPLDGSESANQPANGNGQEASTTEPSADSGVNREIADMRKDEKNYNWVIIVKDSATVASPVETTVEMDLTATNASGGIEGKYSGTMTTSSVSKNSAYAATATSDKKTGTVNFSIGPVLAPLVDENAEDDRLAPLVPDEPGDGRLAPLVPNDKEALAPLVGPENEPDYEGDGTLAISNPTGTTQIQGLGVAAQKQHTSASSFPVHFSIKGANVRMTMTTPQGDLYFDGFIRGEGK
ncbi:hypothetical protein HZA44_03880 [Candidatus Peregrinibacteria bacterium]|nr:hypothetical protein [Candidatus Peregrinibacteria bacterium]